MLGALGNINEIKDTVIHAQVKSWRLLRQKVEIRRLMKGGVSKKNIMITDLQVPDRTL